MFTIFILVLTISSEPVIVDWFDTMQQCVPHIKSGMECVEAQVYRPS